MQSSLEKLGRPQFLERSCLQLPGEVVSSPLEMILGIRPPFQGESIREVFPGLKPWTVLFSPFGRWRNVLTPTDVASGAPPQVIGAANNGPWAVLCSPFGRWGDVQTPGVVASNAPAGMTGVANNDQFQRASQFSAPDHPEAGWPGVLP
jgi:hypothetical protein